jgi:hypothetical protein
LLFFSASTTALNRSGTHRKIRRKSEENQKKIRRKSEENQKKIRRKRRRKAEKKMLLCFVCVYVCMYEKKKIRRK